MCCVSDQRSPCSVSARGSGESCALGVLAEGDFLRIDLGFFLLIVS
jgi:hypothetical protein